jgi:gliding motility associated protien GldN
MRKYRILLVGLVAFVALTSRTVAAQDTKMEVYDKIHIPEKKAVPYAFTREADVMWSKIVWRMIDLREKMNLPLYYPLQQISSRQNLITLLLNAMKTENLQAYSALDMHNEFLILTTPSEVELTLGGGVDSITVDGIMKVSPKELRLEEVTKLLIKEKWFFDRNYSKLDVRILGICPIRVADRFDADGNPTGDKRTIPVCWFYYPDIRNLLASHSVFNANNDAQAISFEDLFWQRRFSSYIYKESNVYNDRTVIDYANGVEAMYESERIKEYIFNFEHDLWEY